MKAEVITPKILLFIISVMLIFVNSGCVSYYKQNQMFNQELSSGNTELAYKYYVDNKINQKKRNRILLLVNKGTLKWMMKDYKASIDFFNKADLMIESYRKNLINESLSMIINPGVKVYKAEDFENIMVNYYKAMAYIKLGDTDNALVECRRINEKLYSINDKYPQNYKNRYSNDAFAHLLMGLIYDATKDYNNAFIAYRNAYNIYKGIYSSLFYTKAPEQLKKDIVRSAYKAGLDDEYIKFKSLFGIEYTPENKNNGELTILWMSGLSPIKDEWSLGLNSLGISGKYITFNNSNESISMPIYIGNLSKSEKLGLSDIRFMNIAFPKYVERPLHFNLANINVNNKEYPLEKVQDINAIAFKCLKDRMLREISNSILRLTIKKSAENLVSQENEYLGFALSLINAATESADTRNWQTLPHSIFYTKISLPKGKNEVKINMYNNFKYVKTKTYTVDIEKHQTKFIIHQDISIENN